jgi:hypothetical protein
MKTLKSIFVTVVLFSITSNAQITKGNWMVGGTGNLTFYENKAIQNGNDVGDKGYVINISPNIGYFFINKLAVGSTISLGYLNSNRYESQGYGFGPFIRYYFLKEEKQINVFAHAYYVFGESKSGNNINGDNGYGFKAGPAIFFNKNVAMEVTLDYNSRKLKLSEPNSSTYNAFQISLGFQIHLKNKK